jgi:hypothetical protein
MLTAPIRRTVAAVIFLILSFLLFSRLSPEA